MRRGVHLRRRRSHRRPHAAARGLPRAFVRDVPQRVGVAGGARGPGGHVPLLQEDDQNPGWKTEVTGDASTDQGLRIAQGFTDKYGIGVQSTVVFVRGTTLLISTQGNEGAGLGDARRGNAEQVRQLQPLLAELG